LEWGSILHPAGVAEEEKSGVTTTANRVSLVLVLLHIQGWPTVLQAHRQRANVNEAAQDESRPLTFAYAATVACSCRLQKNLLTQPLVSLGQTLTAVDPIADWHWICLSIAHR
jgi:hypothetical protein